jgi:hypothetical protein
MPCKTKAPAAIAVAHVAMVIIVAPILLNINKICKYLLVLIIYYLINLF